MGRISLRRLADRLTFANVISVVALFIALGGGAYAAVKVKKNSVGTKQVKDDSLTGVDINEPSLGTVPSAGDAARLGGLGAAAFARGGLSWIGVPAAHQSGNPPGRFRCLGSDGVVCDIYFSNYNSAGDYADAAYARDGFGIVHLQGSVVFTSSAAGAVNHGSFLDLPPGYQPKDRSVFPVLKNGAELTGVDVDPDGSISFRQDYEPGDWFSLDGIDFPCAPAGADGCPAG